MIIPKGKTIQLRGGKVLKEGDEISDAEAKKLGIVIPDPKKVSGEPKKTGGV